MAQTNVQALIKKKKKWYTVVAPKELSSIVIGETPATEVELLKGRTVKANLMTLTNDMKKQNITVTFRITGVKESIAESDLTGYEITPAHVRRLIKRAKDKVEDSFEYETKDGQKIVIKPLLLTKCKAQRGVLTGLRMAARAEIAKEAKKKGFIELVLSIVNNELQKDIKQAIKKVYPVSIVEIRVIKLL